MNTTDIHKGHGVGTEVAADWGAAGRRAARLEARGLCPESVEVLLHGDQMGLDVAPESLAFSMEMVRELSAFLGQPPPDFDSDDHEGEAIA